VVDRALQGDLSINLIFKCEFACCFAGDAFKRIVCDRQTAERAPRSIERLSAQRAVLRNAVKAQVRGVLIRRFVSAVISAERI
jgi:hypothetical protein